MDGSLPFVRRPAAAGVIDRTCAVTVWSGQYLEVGA